MEIEGHVENCTFSKHRASLGEGAYELFDHKFTINNQTIQFSCAQRIQLRDGDRVIVAGTMKPNFFRARAIHNIETGEISHEKIWLRVYLAVVAWPIFGLVISTYFGGPIISSIIGKNGFLVCYLLFLFWSSVLIFRSTQSAIALAKVK